MANTYKENSIYYQLKTFQLMKKLDFLMSLGLFAASLTAQAQTTVASLGFEQGDSKYTTAGAYTPGGTFGDWINKAEGDEWNEQFGDDKHSGEFALQMQNATSLTGNTWDRGFKVGNLQLKDNTAYRVSFWLKAEAEYTNADGAQATRNLKSTLSIGKEYFDMPISTASGQQYYYTFQNMNGAWKHYSYVTYFTNKADQDALSDSFSGKTDAKGDTVSQVGDPFPNEYFITINMYNPGEYLLDDILLEEGVTFNEATFVDDVIKLDFGYPTNIADLAKANEGNLTLDPSQVSVTVDGTPAPVEYLEGRSDGYLYIFLNETYIEEGQQVTVSFTPAADCPILYTTDKRPSADVTSEMQVLGFTGETAYYDANIDALPSAWSEAKLVSTYPENNSFEIVASELTNISFTYNKPLSLDMASATLSTNGIDTDLTDAMTLSEDGTTVNIAVSNLADGSYTVTLSGVANIYGVDCTTDQSIAFEVGEDTEGGTSETVWATDFDNEMTGGIPSGWITYNEAGFHLYGFNDEERTSQYNYNWGGTPGGGGARLYEGFSGDFVKAMYWGTRGTNEGYATYGEQIKDWILEDGTIDPEMPENIALQLEARKYQISFLMAAWKGEPTFTFTLEDLDGNVYAKFADVLAAPNVNGATGKVTGSVKCVTDFTVPQAGYYVLRFTAAEAQWQEYLLANVSLITMPSKAAYYKQMLANAVETAEPIYEMAAGEEYDGETKTAFAAALNAAKNDHFTSPSEIEALIEQLETLGAAMKTRVDNIDNFSVALIEATIAYEALEGKYAEAEIAIQAKEMIDKYETTNPSDLSDEELAEVTPILVNAAAQMGNVQSIVDILTWRGYKAFQTASTLQVESGIKYDALNLTSDDDKVITACNEASKKALYQMLAAGEIADSLKTTAMFDGSKIVEDGVYVDKAADEIAAQGVDFTCLIKNPHFYTYGTDAGAALQDGTIVGWNCTQFEKGSVHFSGDAATEAKPVSDVMINAYGSGAEYKFYQTIENAPVGVYDVWFGTRTASNTYTNSDGESVFEPYNAMNDETGIWDKYIFAQVDDEAPVMVPFAIGGWGTHPTVIKNVTVGKGQKLTIGIVENYTSGKATKGGEAKDFWDTNTFADDARLYFVAPLAGFDYSTAIRITVGDITNLIAKYLEEGEGGTTTVGDITDLIEAYLNQGQE